MTKTSDSDDLARLKASDPLGAHDVGDDDVDLTELRARVMGAAIADEAAEPTRGASRGRVIGVGIAAAVGLLAAGTLAGVAVGRATSDQPILAIAEEEAVPAVNTGAATAIPGVAAPAIGAQDASAKSMIWPGYSADGFIPAVGLADAYGDAQGYRLSSDGIDTTALARQLADAFGVPGNPTSADGMTSIGDGSGPTVWVYSDAMVSWSYADNTRNPWNCGDTSVSTPDSAQSSPGSDVPQPCDPVAEPISEGDARDQAEALLAALGVTDAPGMNVGLDWETYTDGATTAVTAWQTLDGQRTQLSWSFTFDAQGALWANGFAAGLESVGDLPVVGARTAVLRAADPQWRAFGPSPLDAMVMPMARADAGEPAPASVSAAEPTAAPAPTTPPAQIASSITIAWDPITVTDAQPTLAQYWSPDGGYWLLPAYRLSTADDRGDWVVIAVAESAVTFSAQP